MPKTNFAHLSDLHFGASDRVERAARQLVTGLLDADIEHVVITGDLTHRGRRGELLAFQRAFAPLLTRGRVTLVPGNHDRLGDNVGDELMGADRVDVVIQRGLHLVRVDSTGPHNRYLTLGHGDLSAAMLDAIVARVEEAEPGALVVVLLHHHVRKLPEEMLIERFSSWIGWPSAHELPLGAQLCERLRGRCDLILHGHRHVPQGTALFADDERPLHIHNAGCSTALWAARIFEHEHGRLCGPPSWLEVPRQPHPAMSYAMRAQLPVIAVHP